tara:strand:- start:89 stop:355 length:267 start_codon:yes stop_codon:yes gene_type:complete
MINYYRNVFTLSSALKSRDPVRKVWAINTTMLSAFKEITHLLIILPLCPYSCQIEVPTLLLWGEKDIALGKELAIATKVRRGQVMFLD